MELQSNRLRIRELALTDLLEIHQLHSFPETDEFNTLGIPANIGITESLLSGWIRQQNVNPRTTYIFCIELLETNRFIGLAAITLGKLNYKIAEVWYKIHPGCWGKGYATEALSTLIEFGFRDLGLHRIEAGCATGNIASIKVLEKVGMSREGSKRKILPIRGEWVDNYFYSILETELE
ncbi:GNAT family N-acetyltransferase [Flavihumibacter sp. R14]|nr:GNAT family N-acetyltransferase [Flavihumibacter soli]